MPEPAEDPIVVPADPAASPFKLVVDPALRAHLRQALLELVENHDAELAKYASEGFLELQTSQEYVELFARHLRDTMSTKEGVAYLLNACGFTVEDDAIQLEREATWRVQR